MGQRLAAGLITQFREDRRVRFPAPATAATLGGTRAS